MNVKMARQVRSTAYGYGLHTMVMQMEDRLEKYTWLRKEEEIENGLMDAGSDHGSATERLAIDLEVADSGLVSCSFPFLCVVL